MTSELTFRAQLVIREQRELYDYWRAKATPAGFASRADIDPVALSGTLVPLVSIIDVGATLHDLTYRLAGTGLRDIFATELRGRRVFDLELGDKRHYWQTVYQSVVAERVPMQGAVKGPVANRGHLVLFWLRLPLSDDSRRINKVLCYDKALPVSVALAPDSLSVGQTG